MNTFLQKRFSAKLSVLLAVLASAPLIASASGSKNVEPYSELFVESVHSREACDVEFKGCRVRLQKRVEDFYVIVRGEQSFLSNEVAHAAANALETTLAAITTTTGLKPIWEKPDEPTPFIFLVFVNEDQFASDPENFIAARVAPSIFEQREQRKKVFETLMFSELDCVYYSSVYDDGIIRDAQIWIKVDVKPEKMAECITEEFFNSMGLDDSSEHPGIFTWPTASLQGNETPVALQDIHLRFLERLYQPDMKPNQSEDETRRILGLE